MPPDFPFLYDEYDMPMNTRALPVDRIVEVSRHYTDELALKEEILAADHRYYCQAAPGTEPMQWETIGHMLPNMARHYPEHFALAVEGDRWRWTNRLLESETCFTIGDATSLPPSDGVDSATRPLDWLGRQVQEDICLMDGTVPGTPLVAGHLCFAGNWSLDEKMEKPFLAIHEGVPQFAERIARPASLVMERLKADRPIGRLNWTITATDRLNCAPTTFHEWLHLRRGITMRNAGERLYLRLEWQTLSRLPRTGGILFTIHTTRTPISALTRDPVYLRRFTNVIKGTPRPAREYKGFASFADALVDYLESRCREVEGHPATTASRLPDDLPRPPAALHPEIADWEPFQIEPFHVLEGDPRARVQWLRRDQAHRPRYQTGLLELQPCRLRWLVTGNETCHLLTGSATVESDDGTTLVLGPGDAASFHANTVTIWTIHEPLRRMFVISM